MLVLNHIQLAPTRLQDAPTVVKWMQDKEISENTLVIPYPYNLEDAQTWLEDNQIFEEENGFTKNFAIRYNNEMIGCIGLQYNFGLQSDKSEFGYWLAKPYWNNGIITEVIKQFCELVKAGMKIKLLEAHVFSFNAASQRVLIKAGFTQYEKVTGKYKKDGKKIDAIRFAKHL